MSYKTWHNYKLDGVVSKPPRLFAIIVEVFYNGKMQNLW